MSNATFGHGAFGGRTARCRWRCGLRTAWAVGLLFVGLASTGCASLGINKPSFLKTPEFLSRAPKEDPLTTAVSSKDPAARLAALKRLVGEANGPRRDQISNQLAALMANEPSSPIRLEMCRTLAHFRNPAADQAVRKCLKDSDTDVRIAAANSLALHGSKGLHPNERRLEREQASRKALSDALTEDANIDVKLVIVKSLGHFDGDDVKIALGAALDDSNPAIQRRAMQALGESTGKDFGFDARAWREYVQGGTPTPRTETMADRFKTYMLTY